MTHQHGTLQIANQDVSTYLAIQLNLAIQVDHFDQESLTVLEILWVPQLPCLLVDLVFLMDPKVLEVRRCQVDLDCREILEIQVILWLQLVQALQATH